jgi:hypothetical protein
MLQPVALVRTDVSDKRITSIIRMKKSALTIATLLNIPEHGIFHSHRCENLKPYIVLAGWAL